MKAVWTRVTLGEVCEVVGGGTPKTSVAAYWDGDVPWATPKDLSDQGTRYISRTARSITSAGLNGSGARILPAGSVLLSSRAPIGLVAINTVPMATNQGFKSLVPDRDWIDPAFLAHWLAARTEYLQSLGSGATFKEISKAVVARIEIPLPPLADQRRIAQILDTASTIRIVQSQAANSALALLDSSFQRAFGDPVRNNKRWPVSTIGNVASVITGSTPPRSEPENYGGSLGWAKNDDIRDDRVYVTEPEECLSVLGASRGRTVGAECVLVTCISGSPSEIGRVALTSKAIAFNQQINGLVPQGVDPRFLYAQLRLSRPILRRASTGGMKGLISKTSLQKVPLIAPPIAAQRAWGRLVDAIAKRLTAEDERCAHIAGLCGSLEDRAFNAEL